jgi:hypothetical protein
MMQCEVSAGKSYGSAVLTLNRFGVSVAFVRKNADKRKIRTLNGFVVMMKRKMPVTARDDDDDDYDYDNNSPRVSRCSCLQYFGDFFTSSRWKTQAFAVVTTN